MREFLEDDLRRAERHIREAERHFARQKSVVRRLENLGHAEQAQRARARLVELQKGLELARDVLRLRQSKSRPTT